MDPLMERLLGLPEIASEHGARLDQAMGLVHWLMLVLFVVWTAVFLFILYRFSHKRQPKASYEGVNTHLSSYGEVAVAFVEVLLLVGFSIPLYSERVDDQPPEDEAVVVRVIGQQFAWNIHYPGPDGVFGPTSADLVDEESNPIGLDRNHPDAADDVTTVNQLHLPVDQPVLIKLSTKDVIHSFFIPEMRVKQDAIPGMEIPVWFVPTVTTAEMREIRGEEDYSYEIGCAQLCGLGHYRMRGFTTIHTAEDYQAWMDEEQSYLAAEEESDDFWG